MWCPARLLALSLLWGCSPEAGAQCRENTACRELGSEENLMECVQLCKSALEGEAGRSYIDKPVRTRLPEDNAVGKQAEDEVLGVSPVEEGGTQVPREAELPHNDKRSYPMEHFRWGKPVGRKRRPIKVYSNGMEEELPEGYPMEARRSLPTELDYTPGVQEEEDEVKAEQQLQEKKDGTYKMNHFRWGGPPASKRYGGFMKSWGGHSQKPLMTLFRNIMIKDGH
ncbi:pro-opiomelanocortin-1-like [Scleropages formosus]|uniref:pro-opiomelanocortin-1-like n=1 Tax=Scleropages formosus TaxID=113540 RepID=UPI0010FA7983|nr:pro-opiomelanocortin-1-like [Scleropages formosus]